MTGIPTVPDTTGKPVVDSLALGRTAGLTAQGWLGTALAAGGSIGNSSAVVAPGQPTPDDTRTGYLGAGQPGGSNNALVPGGQYSTDDQIQLIGAPAGTAGGGGVYPATTSNPVRNPLVSPGWTVQSSDVNIEFAYAPASVSHTAGGTVSPTVLALTNGGTGTFTVAVKEVNGVLTSTLPTGFTSVAANTGVFTIGTTGTAGVYSFGLTVTDSSGRTAEASVTITLT